MIALSSGVLGAPFKTISEIIDLIELYSHSTCRAGLVVDVLYRRRDRRCSLRRSSTLLRLSATLTPPAVCLRFEAITHALCSFFFFSTFFCTYLCPSLYLRSAVSFARASGYPRNENNSKKIAQQSYFYYWIEKIGIILNEGVNRLLER